jgi:hypothetical protein
MKNLLIGALSLALLSASAACGLVSADRSGPTISNVKTSGNVLVISDCSGTSVEISAKVADASGVESAMLWYRVEAEQKFDSTRMELRDGAYTAPLEGPDFLGKAYGTIEFYITAKDKAGNTSRTSVDRSMQFLPCVSN